MIVNRNHYVFNTILMDQPFKIEEKIAALCGIIWFAWIIDACYTWFFSWPVRHFISAIFVFYATIRLKKKDKLVVNRHRKILFFMILCLLVLKMFFKWSPYLFLNSPFVYAPMLCILFWNRQTIIKLYEYFRIFIIFYSVLSIIVEFLFLSGYWTSLPYITFPPQDNVQEESYTINRFYGFFVIPDSPIENLFYRAMGPLREGGHFSIFVGFAYFIEKAIFNRRNILLIIAGFLTLSPNFVFFLIVSELYFAIKSKKILKAVGGLFMVVVVVLLAFVLSPQSIKDEIVGIVMERSLQRNIENVELDGYTALIDGRANWTGILMYDDYMKHAGLFQKLIGIPMSSLKKDYVLSDFRYLLVLYGYLGMMLFVSISYVISFEGKKTFFGLCIFIFAIYVMLSRAWMFEEVYVWTMMLLAVSAKFVYDNQHCLVEN